MKKKRSQKHLDEFTNAANHCEFFLIKKLYIKEKDKLKNEGFTVERIYSEENEIPKAGLFLYKISWEKPEGDLANTFYNMTMKAIEDEKNDYNKKEQEDNELGGIE